MSDRLFTVHIGHALAAVDGIARWAAKLMDVANNLISFARKEGMF